MILEWNGVGVCVHSCSCEFGGGAEQVGGGHSLNNWGKVGVEIVCFCLFFIMSVDSGNGCVPGVKIVGQCVFVSRVQSSAEWCELGEAYAHVCTGARENAYCMCICLRLLIIRGYFFQTRCYALFCMIYSPASQAAGLVLCQLQFGRAES